MLNNTKLRHFWAQIVSWAPRHARKTFIVLAPSYKPSTPTLAHGGKLESRRVWDTEIGQGRKIVSEPDKELGRNKWGEGRGEIERWKCIATRMDSDKNKTELNLHNILTYNDRSIYPHGSFIQHTTVEWLAMAYWPFTRATWLQVS